MTYKFLGFVVLMAVGMSSCDKISPPAENANAESVSATENSSVKAKEDAKFSPRLLDAPVLGSYTPGFPYSVRSKAEASAGNGGKASVALEFWGVTAEQAEQQVHSHLLNAGFKSISKKSGNGSWSNRYESKEGLAVLMNVSPIGARSRTAPGSVGTIYFEWMQ